MSASGPRGAEKSQTSESKRADHGRIAPIASCMAEKTSRDDFSRDKISFSEKFVIPLHSLKPR